MAQFYGLTIVAIGRAAAIVRAKIERRGAPEPTQGIRLNVCIACLCARLAVWRSRWRWWHAGIAAPVRADFRHHVFPNPSPAAKTGEAASGNGQECAAGR